MKIMHLLKHCAGGNGGVHVAVDLACEQVRAGHDVVFASAGGAYDGLLRANGVEVVTIPEPGGVRGTARSARAVLAAVRRSRPEVIHAHMMSSAVLGFGSSLLTGAPLVTTMHNSFDGHSVLMRLGKVVVAVSEAERQLLLSRGYPRSKVVSVLNGTGGSAREAVEAEPLGPFARPCVVTLSGLHRRKAVGDVISAFAEVTGDFPEWHLNVVGWGPDRENLEAKVGELGLGDRVHFMGSTPNPHPLLRQADIFATATLADPCPLTVTEARAAGCAIVATAVGGIPELLDHGRAGQLTPVTDPPAMAAAFRSLMGDPANLATWRARAKNGSEHFAVRRVAQDYLAVYRSVVRATRSGPAGADRRLRVAYFVPPSRHFAGIERVVHEIASGLMEAHGDVLDVHVVSSSRYDDKLLVDPPYTLHVLDVDRLRRLPPALRARISELRPDVLVCPQVEASVLAWLATRGLRVPHFVAHLHGNPRIEEQDGSRSTRIAFALFRHLVSRRVSAVLAVSSTLRDYAARSVTRRAPVFYARNPARDLGAAGPAPRHDGPFRLLNVARLSPQKGQDVLLRALALARPELPPVVLTLVGSGPDEAELKRLCRELGLDDIVVFAGYAADPADHFRAADAFVLPSRWEGFGLVLVEALQFGLPLLSTGCDFGPSDIVTDPRIGELVAPDSPEQLAEGLKRTVHREPDPEDAEFRRAAARRYSRDEATRQHLEILREIVAAHPAADRPVAFTASR